MLDKYLLIIRKIVCRRDYGPSGFGRLCRNWGGEEKDLAVIIEKPTISNLNHRTSVAYLVRCLNVGVLRLILQLNDVIFPSVLVFQAAIKIP